MKASNENIFLVIERTCEGKKKVSWQEIVADVKGTGMVIKNWMKVRNVLQWFISNDRLVRTDDLRVEEYKVH